MDHDRIKEAYLAFQKNCRKALRASGVEPKMDSMQVPSAGSSLMEGVNATSEELLAWARWQMYDVRRGTSALVRTASIGMAVEMGMHEINGEFSHAIYALKEICDNAEPDSRIHKRADDALASVRRLSNLTDLTSRFTQNWSSSRSAVTGEHILQRSTAMFDRWIDEAKITVTASPDFLKATMHGSDYVTVPVFLNLIRNALYWAPKGGQPPRIDLDAKEVSYQETGEDENGITKTVTRTEWIFSVADNGPGVPENERENIFRPFVSGRSSSGIGLYLARRNMESAHKTVVLSPEPHPLGGACFLVGSRLVLDPVPALVLSEREKLLMAAAGIVQMIADGRADDVLRDHADEWAEIGREVLRVRIQGIADTCDARLAEAFALANGLLERRIGSDDLPDWLQDDWPAPSL